ncbi:MAG: flavodoxin domain-containing protein [Lachnospiraceae bacterium]|nr:flavodoxin domain-containing protein [Lachnospiraceae bacterium]
MKLAVIYDSKTNNTKMAAEWIVSGMSEVEGVDAKAFSIQEVDEEFVKEAKGVVFGSPSYATAMTPDMHNFLMPNAMKLGLGGKLGGAFATEQFTHGGGDLVIQALLNYEMTNGMLCYSGGNAWGLPNIHLGPVAVNNNKEAHNGMEHYKEYFVIYGNRFASKASELF